MLDVLIIGGGPAGLSAAIYTFRKKMNTLVVSKDIGGQVAKSGEIENYLGFGHITGPMLAMKFREHLEALGISYKEGVVVKSITGRRGEFRVGLEDGEEILAKTVIVASGKNPKQLNVPGEAELKNRGVSYCATCDAPLFRNKTVAVIGGGNSALDAAIQFIPIAQKIYLININPEFTGDPIFIDKVKNEPKITIINNAQTKEILGQALVSGLKYQELTTREEKEITVEGVFVEIGQIPSLGFENLLTKNKWGMIEIGENGITNIPGLFAAGDVTNVRDNQISVAAGEGTKAALSAYEFWVKELSGTETAEAY